MRQIFLFCTHRMGWTEGLFPLYNGGYLRSPPPSPVTQCDSAWTVAWRLPTLSLPKTATAVRARLTDQAILCGLLAQWSSHRACAGIRRRTLVYARGMPTLTIS